MKLYETEAKKLLREYGLNVPEEAPEGEEPYAVKAQVLEKNRKQKGGIKFAQTLEEAEKIREDILGINVGRQEVDNVLIEEKVDIEAEYYVSFLYDTDTRSPVLVFSLEGGSGVEDRKTCKMEFSQLEKWKIRSFLKEQGVPSSRLISLSESIHSIGRCFLEEDARMIEVNPLARTPDGLMVVDAMIDLDDDASYRHDWNYPERSDMGREKSEREIRAEKIDEGDHRGIAGKYTELDGDVGMMLAGGGASLTNMDALIACGGEPANYTEYGGNPPTEKVYKLSKVIMSKDINALWHVGGTANNTDICRTMKGFCEALEEEEPDYPIVVRRDGPNADKAFELLRKTRDDLKLNMKLFRNRTPMTETADVLMDMKNEFEGDKN